MKLSVALRKGIRVCPIQAFGAFHFNGASCAVGAIHDGFVAENIPSGIQRLNIKYTTCPVCDHCNYIFSGSYLQGAIQHLNDQIKWSREKIADWLESIGE